MYFKLFVIRFIFLNYTIPLIYWRSFNTGAYLPLYARFILLLLLLLFPLHPEPPKLLDLTDNNVL